MEKKKKEKQDYEDLMEQLEKEVRFKYFSPKRVQSFFLMIAVIKAFVKLVKMEQEKMELERQKEEEERKSVKMPRVCSKRIVADVNEKKPSVVNECWKQLSMEKYKKWKTSYAKYSKHSLSSMFKPLLGICRR